MARYHLNRCYPYRCLLHASSLCAADRRSCAAAQCSHENEANWSCRIDHPKNSSLDWDYEWARIHCYYHCQTWLVMRAAIQRRCQWMLLLIERQQMQLLLLPPDRNHRKWAHVPSNWIVVVCAIHLPSSSDAWPPDWRHCWCCYWWLGHNKWHWHRLHLFRWPGCDWWTRSAVVDPPVYWTHPVFVVLTLRFCCMLLPLL